MVDDEGDGEVASDWQMNMRSRCACKEMLNVDVCEILKSVSMCLLNLGGSQ